MNNPIIRAFLISAAMFMFGESAMSQTLYYDRISNSGWVASNMWGATDSGPYNASWSNGNIANFSSSSSSAAVTVSLAGNVSINGLVNTGSTVSIGGSGARVITSNGGNVSGDFTLTNNAAFTGDFALTNGSFNWTGDVDTAFSGTGTLSGGTLTIGRASRVSTGSNFTVDGGTMSITPNAATTTMGGVTVNSGSVFIGRTDTDAVNLIVSSLQGSGGSVMIRSSSNVSAVDSLTVDQATNTTYAGTIVGANTAGSGTLLLSVTKAGSGNLTLSGNISGLQRTTTIKAGGLYINSSSTSFGDGVGSTAITVKSGAILGGTGTISTLSGDSVVVENGGKLVAGLQGASGRTTYALGTGASLDLSGATSATGWLNFDLGSNVTAGGTYDQIKITSGNLNIGSGILNFDDFGFIALSGFGQGVYTLFDTPGITGTLGSSLTGTIGGYNASISLSANNLLLTVAPEPRTWILLGVGFAVLLFRSRKQQR